MKKVLKKSRHVRWNWEKSPENDEMVRYHFIVVDDKDREGKIRKILESIQIEVSSNYSFDKKRSVEGKVKETDFRYLFETYDTYYSPSLLNMKVVFPNSFKDNNLRERKVGSIEDYIANIYSK